MEEEDVADGHGHHREEEEHGHVEEHGEGLHPPLQGDRQRRESEIDSNATSYLGAMLVKRNIWAPQGV